MVLYIGHHPQHQTGRADRGNLEGGSEMKLPPIKDIRALLIALKPTIGDEYRADEFSADDTTPSMLVTIGADESGNWSWQTGDNSYMGGAYGYPHWALVALTRRANCTELARDAINQIAELIVS